MQAEHRQVLLDRLVLARAAADRKRRIRRKADAFLIWRTMRAMRGECSAAELAQITGLTHHRVTDICEERGWSLGPDDPDDGIVPVDTLVARGEPREFVTVNTPHGPRVMLRQTIGRWRVV